MHSRILFQQIVPVVRKTSILISSTLALLEWNSGFHVKKSVSKEIQEVNFDKAMLTFAGISNIPLSQWWVASPFEYPPLTCSASTSRGQGEISVGEDGELQHYEIMLIIILESQMMTAKVRYDRFCYQVVMQALWIAG